MRTEFCPAKQIIITADQAGQRLDNFLFARFRQLPKSRIYKMVRKGEVRINGGRVKQAYRIQAGDRLRVPPVRIDLSPQTDRPIPDKALASLEQSILFEDENLLVLSKPAGLAVHAGSGVPYGVIEILRQLRSAEPFLELVHRLDRGTSGILLIARNRNALMQMHQLLRDGEIKKVYLTLAAGKWRGGTKRIESSLQREGGKGQVRRTQQKENGKRAVSEFDPVRIYADASLLKVRIYTGRTHQIRVQAADAGFPLLGDNKYGDFKANREWRKKGLKRLFLHAAELSFKWPDSGQKIHLKSPLPSGLQKVIDKLDE
jgi:23S rRNA pseudouridine955/2504/2580 synthase